MSKRMKAVKAGVTRTEYFGKECSTGKRIPVIMIDRRTREGKRLYTEYLARMSESK